MHNLLATVYKTDKGHFDKNPYLIETLVPDLQMYMNLWLCAATFASK